jgi:uncharacterized protein YraI
MFCVACNSVELDTLSTNTPSFVTATLPPTSAPAQATQTLILLSTDLVPTVITNPVEGTTTTQINVRAETTTASESLGVIPAFTNIQIIGKESSGNWFKIIYNESTGWVRTEFVQVESSDNIAVVEIESGSGSNRSGVVISGINVRSGAGTEFESIGVLTPKDVVIILGKDSSGAWMQINFQGNLGWVAAEFLQIENVEQILVIETAQSTPVAPVINETPIVVMQIANVDNDSIQSPFVKLFFEEDKILQITGEVSAPQGDNEDWVEFSSASSKILIESSCTNTGLQVELWQASAVVENFSAICENDFVINVSQNESYTLKIFTGDASFIKYSLKFKVGK